MFSLSLYCVSFCPSSVWTEQDCSGFMSLLLVAQEVKYAETLWCQLFTERLQETLGKLAK